MRQKIASVKNFVSRHRVGIAVVATAATCYAVNREALNQHNEFLKEHDLYDEFYALEETV